MTASHRDRCVGTTLDQAAETTVVAIPSWTESIHPKRHLFIQEELATFGFKQRGHDWFEGHSRINNRIYATGPQAAREVWGPLARSVQARETVGSPHGDAVPQQRAGVHERRRADPSRCGKNEFARRPMQVHTRQAQRSDMHTVASDE